MSDLKTFGPDVEPVYGQMTAFYGMIEAFPLKQAIPMIFKGGGDCANVDWTLLGLSIANWSFLAFVGLELSALWVLYDARRVRLNPPMV